MSARVLQNDNHSPASFMPSYTIKNYKLRKW